ncbi:MAG: hypothetical protein CVU13_09880 [Bacteroidetes bacterium HGW-Bacteroidetes-8]|jgi:hypothetical protein|nr:MAG: hypothetical protein CVU13_09880 [Bacteroidetes bacterium HGW-Bacteroidetes-8]
MTKRLTFFVSVLIASLIQSCDSNPNVTASKIPVIDLESAIGSGRVFNLSDVATEIRYIPLETNDNSMMSDYLSVVYEKGMFYVISFKNFIIFDSCGKHLKTFNRTGRGPDEYMGFKSYDVDPKTGNILLTAFCQDQAFSLLSYSVDGKLEDKYSLNSTGRSMSDISFRCLDDKILTTFSVSIEDTTEVYAQVQDLTGNILKSVNKPSLKDFNDAYTNLPSPVVQKNGMSFSTSYTTRSTMRIPPRAYRYEDKMRIFLSLSDTIFTIDTALNYTPFLAINYGKYKNPSELGSNITKGEHVSISSNLFFETGSLILTQFNLRSFAHDPFEIPTQNGKGTSKNTKSFALYDKNSGELTLMNTPMPAKPGFKEDFESGPPFFPSYLSSEMYAISIIYPDKLKSFAQSNPVSPKLKSIANNLKEFDNPVVVLVKMK